MDASTRRSRTVLMAVLAFGWLVFQLYILFSPQLPMVQRPIHLVFALAIFLLAPPRNGTLSSARGWIDGLLLIGVFAVLGYYLSSWQRLTGRMEAVDPILTIDILFGILLVGIMLECVRRAVGWSLLGVIAAFLVFGFLGRIVPGWTSLDWVPEMIKFSGFTLGDAAENFTMKPKRTK